MNTAHSEGLKACATLANGVQMPWLGLGTAGRWTPYGKSSPGAAKLGSERGVAEAVTAALDVGYRLVDTAPFYGNEEAVGHAVATHPVDREQVFITTKVWNDDIAAGAEATRNSVEASLARLGIEAADLLLLHWPVPGYEEAWQVLEEVYAQGKTRAIGVSNFQVNQLQELMAQATISPMVNQVEFHPYLVQPELLRFCRVHDIQHHGWSPLMVGNVGQVPKIVDIAAAHEKTPFQVAIRWALQHRSVTIPKSVRPERIAENADVFDFELKPSEMQVIDRLDRNERIGPDPEQFPARWKDSRRKSRTA
jgi:methylglyoxal/glyoxal reductase